MCVNETSVFTVGKPSKYFRRREKIYMYKYNKINAHIFLNIFDNLQKDDALNLIKKKKKIEERTTYSSKS